MGKLFISHSSKDDDFVRRLRQALHEHGEDGWIDSRELCGSDSILVALGKRRHADVAPTLQPKAEPLEELVLELTDLKFQEQDGKRRASARARLVYLPATSGQQPLHSAQKWTFIEPIGPIEKDDLRWYLEEFAIWPSGVPVIQERARKVEANLIEWGKQLPRRALPPASVNFRHRPKPASSAAAANCSPCNACSVTNATPPFAARAAKAKPLSLPNSPAGWSAPSNSSASPSSPSKSTPAEILLLIETLEKSESK